MESEEQLHARHLYKSVCLQSSPNHPRFPVPWETLFLPLPESPMGVHDPGLFSTHTLTPFHGGHPHTNSWGRQGKQEWTVLGHPLH